MESYSPVRELKIFENMKSLYNVWRSHDKLVKSGKGVLQVLKKFKRALKNFKKTENPNESYTSTRVSLGLSQILDFRTTLGAKKIESFPHLNFKLIR